MKNSTTKSLNWPVRLGLSLIALSLALYLMQFTLYGDAPNVLFWLIGNLAFVPIQVLLVTIIIQQLLNVREKRAMLKKMNMVIGAFYSEVGTILLKGFADFDPDVDKIRKELVMTDNWTDESFFKVSGQLKSYDCDIDIKKGDLENLQGFLIDKRNFLLRLLENPNLLEHDTFTELLWAVFHLAEELAFRVDVTRLPETDYAHLAGDTKRAYVLLIAEWLGYMEHLKDNYPYLFSLAMRTNPFDLNASVEVR